jgi:2-polyprenyl-3-methyl-5-hydroxy-6-metoxy-1,4-benzoquinol methylase
LDIGCGYGSLVDFLTQQGLEVEGIDSDEEVYNIAQELFHNPKIKLINAERLEEFYRAETVDTITLKDVLHHLVGEGDVHTAFQQFHRILKNNGRIIILDPNPTWILKTARKII